MPGRRGKSVLSCEHFEISFVSIALDPGFGRFPKLNLIDLIPRGLATADYLLRPLAAFGNLIVGFLYNPRYAAAGWMLPILIVGAWFAILGGINESMLLGFSKPAYVPLALAVKMGVLLVGLPIGFACFGVVGAVTVVALSEAIRYFPIVVG